MNSIRAFQIEPDDNQAVEIELPVTNQLSHLQDMVEGWVEVVTSTNGQITFWFNEEGKIKDMPVNGLGTAIWWSVCPEAVNVDTLRGPVVITGGFDSQGATLAIPDDMANILINTYVGEET